MAKIWRESTSGMLTQALASSSSNFLLRVLDPFALLGILGKQLVFAPYLHEAGAEAYRESKLEEHPGASMYVMRINYNTYKLLGLCC